MATAYEKKWPLYLRTKNTILKKYDGKFKYLQFLVLSYPIKFVHGPPMTPWSSPTSTSSSRRHTSPLMAAGSWTTLEADDWYYLEARNTVRIVALEDYTSIDLTGIDPGLLFEGFLIASIATQEMRH
ncbi:hypothetical protein ZEAMMB73_Zm00001d025334 [Zea mays]|uniref:Uncharacterized protein n=1 Tax=Zea mays TaxID=4577 RepID=A0A1D6J6J3_MAIZE|nr:hypothetical protein ZEAMMB73_Zm00001d025334 [Zea mays]